MPPGRACSQETPAVILRPMSSEGANAFIARWAAAGASERANSQPFLCELCNMLGVARPEPTREKGYAFEYDVMEHHPDGSTALGLQGRAALGGSRCQTGKGWSSKSVNSEHPTREAVGRTACPCPN
jgi:hypothetical protein